MTTTQATTNCNEPRPDRSNQYEISPWKPFLVFVLFTLAITSGGFFVFQNYKEVITSDKQNELGGIAELKTGQLIHWMEERRSDAQILKNDPLFVAEVGHWLQQGGPTGETRMKLIERLSALQQADAAFGYTSISLLDDRAMLRLSSSADEKSIQLHETKQVLESMRNGQILMSDIHMGKHGMLDALEIDLVAPLFAGKGKHAHAIGVVLFQIDPDRFIFPLIRHWPTPSASAENLIVRREGNEIVFLNELRHHKNASLAMRLPLSQQQLLATKAVMGQVGVAEGIDCWGVPEVGVLSKVAGTSWYMVSKIDKAEIDAPIDRLADWMLLLMLVLVGTGGGIAVFWWKNEKKQYKSELEHARLARHLNYLGKYANDIIMLVDDTGKIIDINDRALQAYGYSAREFLKMTIFDLQETDFASKITEDLQKIHELGALLFESIHLRKNGESFPVEVSVRAVDIDGKQFHQAILRDITERRQAEKELQRQKIFMWQVIDTDPNRIFVKDAQGRFLLVNQSAAAAHGLAPNEMIGKSLAELDCSPEGGEVYLEADRRVIEDGHEVSVTEPYTLPNGERRWFYTVKKRLTMPDGKLSVLGIAMDITRQKLSEIKLAESYKELQQLSLHLENIRADERVKIARNLHDEMGATLVAIKMGIAWLASKLPGEMPQLTVEAANIAELASDGIRIMHQIVTELRPNLLADAGLTAAIKDYVNKFRQHMNIDCVLALPEQELALNEDQSLTVFRILQEILNNVVKHAQADRVTIRFMERGESLLMVVRDNGIGFDPSLRKEISFGLLGIRERALMVGGKARINSAPGKGTRVSVKIPYTLSHDAQPMP